MIPMVFWRRCRRARGCRRRRTRAAAAGTSDRPGRGGPRERPQNRHHQPEPQGQADQRGEHDVNQRLGPAEAIFAPQRPSSPPPRRSPRSARVTSWWADVIPCDQVPDDRADAPREDHREGHHADVHQAGATVLATAVPKVNAATKLKNAAQTTAFGRRDAVETTVAIEFAAS